MSSYRYVVFLTGADQERLRIGVRTNATNESAVPGIADRVLVNQVGKSTRKSVGAKRSPGSSFSGAGFVRWIGNLTRGGEAQLGSAAHVDVGVHPLLGRGHIDLVRLGAGCLCLCVCRCMDQTGLA